jgi:hypothetical protein
MQGSPEKTPNPFRTVWFSGLPGPAEAKLIQPLLGFGPVLLQRSPVQCIFVYRDVLCISAFDKGPPLHFYGEWRIGGVGPGHNCERMGGDVSIILTSSTPTSNAKGSNAKGSRDNGAAG